MENNYEIHYDEDFLEVFFGEQTPCLADEVEQDIFIRRDEKTGEVKSIGIFGFKKRGAEVLRDVLEKVNLKLPLSVGFE